MTCGNGGSAFTASHFVTDWVKAYKQQKTSKINVISLSDNMGMTAYANDISYDAVFAEQVKFGQAGDLLI